MKQMGHSCVKQLSLVSLPGNRGAILRSTIKRRALLTSQGQVG